MNIATQVDHDVHAFGGIIVRKYRLPAGSEIVTHVHPYDHLSILFSGVCVLTSGGDRRQLLGPRMVEIKAGVAHEIHAITDCEWDCVHAMALAETAAAEGDRYVASGIEKGTG